MTKPSERTRRPVPSLRSESFAHGDPLWRVPITLPANALEPDQITLGDVVYLRKPKGYQRLVTIAGDTWRHIGVIAPLDNSPWLIDMGQGGYAARPFSTVLEQYDTLAVQRIRPCESGCPDRLWRDVASQMRTPTDFYEPLEQTLFGAATTLRLPFFRRHGSFRRVEQYARSALQSRSGLDRRRVCTTPIVHALTRLCEQHSVTPDVTSTKAAPARSADDSAHRFAMPDGLWRALTPIADSFWLKKDGNYFAP